MEKSVNEILSRYPKGKPVCFNYAVAREDIVALIDETRQLNMLRNYWRKRAFDRLINITRLSRRVSELKAANERLRAEAALPQNSLDGIRGDSVSRRRPAPGVSRQAVRKAG